MSRKCLYGLRMVVAFAAVLVGSVMAGSPASADATHQVAIGMPFSGKWAYDTNVNPPYNDENSSHPLVHHTPGGGNWATDIYAGEGAPVKLHVPGATGAVTFGWMASSTSCGQSTRLSVNVDGVNVGWLYFAHLNNAVTSGPITVGMTLGTVHNWGNCNKGPHVHVEFKNASNSSCFADYGHPGASVSEGNYLGMLGSTNTVRQACSSFATPPSPTDADADGIIAGDACSTIPGDAINGGCLSTSSSSTVSYGGQLYVFARGLDNELYVDKWTGSAWTGFVRFAPGSVFAGDPTATVYGNQLYVFARGVDGNVYINSTDGTSWAGFSSIDSGHAVAGNPVVRVHGTGIHVLARGADNLLYNNVFDGAGWSGFMSLGSGGVTFVGDPSAALYGSYLVVYARSSDGEVRTNTWDGSSWGGFVRVQPGAIFSGDPTAVVFRGGVHVFARGTDSQLYDNLWTGSAWTGFVNVQPGSNFAGDPVAVQFGTSLDVFMRGVDNEVYMNNLSPGGVWSGFARLAPGSLFVSDPTAAAYSNGVNVLATFARGNDNELYNNTYSSSGWSGYVRLSPGSLFIGP